MYLTLCDPWTADHWAPLTMEFSRQEYWCGLPFPTSGDLPDPRIELSSLVFPEIAVPVKTSSILELMNYANKCMVNKSLNCTERETLTIHFKVSKFQSVVLEL